MFRVFEGLEIGPTLPAQILHIPHREIDKTGGGQVVVCEDGDLSEAGGLLCVKIAR